ncbi:hypothetical protein [Virgibacillus sp. DJP39]|uniref:hypothetical protein n=1 Tax=Virgibacillus sp. DJP39 TaxID=3409790 RepID=UPI003BB5A2EF
MKEYSLDEVLGFFEEYYITQSQQMVSRWIRHGKLNATRSDYRKDGYRVSEEDLFEFIEEQRPGLRKIYDIYKDHIKQLRSQRIEQETRPQLSEATQVNEIKSEEEIHEMEINQFKDEVINLESKITDLEYDKQLNNEKMLEILEQNSSLEEEVNTLTEDKNTYIQLNKKLNEENKQLKDAAPTMTKSDEKNGKSKNTTDRARAKINSTLTLDEFKKAGKKVISTQIDKFSEKELDEHLINAYNIVSDESSNIKKELLIKDGSFKSPYIDKPYKQQKRFVTHVIEHYFKNLDVKKESTEEKAVANE